jgi:hypothetical protein
MIGDEVAVITGLQVADFDVDVATSDCPKTRIHHVLSIPGVVVSHEF